MKRVGILVVASVVFVLAGGARGGGPGKLPLGNDFLIKVATCNHAAIVIGKMAQTQGSPDVKAFAVRLVKDHEACSEKLAVLFKTRKVGVVSGTEAETKATIKRLGELKGTDFDREYLAWVIKEHRSALPMFENQIKVGKDDDIRVFATEGLDLGRKHLQKAQELAKAIDTK